MLSASRIGSILGSHWLSFSRIEQVGTVLQPLVLWNCYAYIPQEKGEISVCRSPLRSLIMKDDLIVWSIIIINRPWDFVHGIIMNLTLNINSLWGDELQTSTWEYLQITFIVLDQQMFYQSIMTNTFVWWLLNKKLKLVLQAKIQWIIFWVGISTNGTGRNVFNYMLWKSQLSKRKRLKICQHFQDESRFDVKVKNHAQLQLIFSKCSSLKINSNCFVMLSYRTRKLKLTLQIKLIFMQLKSLKLGNALWKNELTFNLYVFLSYHQLTAFRHHF